MATGNKLILIVEDDDSVRKLLERALSQHYSVVSFGDGSSAMKRLAQDPLPDLLICDIMLPGVDGLAVAKEIKKETRSAQVPIIFLTARTGPMDVIHGIQAGARHYMTKPFKLEELMEKVRKIVGT